MEKYNYEGEKFLSKLYSDIHMKQSVIHSSNVSDKKYEKIRKYLDREERVHEKALEKGKLDLLKKAYYDKYIIKEIPKEYIDFLDKNTFDQVGHHLTKTEIEEHKRVIMEDQKKSLSSWIDYLTSEDSKFYPWWAKYWAFQGMLKIGAYDNENGIYGKRDSKTVAPFVELNREALAKSIDLVMKQVKGEVVEEELKELISSGSFTKLYTVLLKKQKEVQYDNRDIDGKWIKYDQGDNYKPLYDSLQGYNTGWCTAGEETCKSQLKNGDFYVYYTKDENGDYKVPRLAIRMGGQTRIGEIRGVDKGQNVEPHLEDVIDKKLENFSDKENYKKRINDSKMLTYIYTKYEHKKELTKDDLRFIYELDRYIEGFGYEEDPRISEIRESRDKRQDMAKAFDCKEDEVGLTLEDLKNEKKLKVFIGSLNLGYLESAEGLKLPETVGGNLDLSGLESAEGLKLPETLGGSLNLSGLKKAEGLKLPKSVGEYLDLSGLESVEDLELPEVVGGDLNLSGLESAEGLKMPETVNGDLNLRGLKNAKDVQFPETIDYNLNLESLVSVEGLELPETVEGSLYLSSLESAEGLKLPETVCGNLNLSGLESAEGLKLPETLRDSLYLSSLKSAEGLNLPETVCGDLFLSGLKSAEGLELPETVEGSLVLSGLESAEGLKLPETVDGYLDLSGLESAEGLKLPETVGSLVLSGLESAEGLKLPETLRDSLFLSGLKSAEGLKLPETLRGSLDLEDLESAEGLKLPETVGEDLYLSSLKSAEGLKLPETVGRELDLRGLKSTEGLNLPETVGGVLDLRGLKSAEGLKLPENVGGRVILPKEIKKQLEEKSSQSKKR